MTGSRAAAGMKSAFGWGFYLACSWTWVIGMFLPLLLIRDFGWPGYVAFLVPNAVGAAAMGILLRKDGASERFVAAHRSAVWAFSLITSIFQWFFFANLLLPPGFNVETVGLMSAATVAALAAVFATRSDPTIRSLSLLLWIASAGLLGWAMTRFPTLPPAYVFRPTGGTPDSAFNWAAFAGLAGCCTLGFALCPYLDRTFHHACQRAGSRRILAFAVGFLVLFAVMVIGTLAYARPLVLKAIKPGDAAIAMRFAIALPAVIHIALQLGFTAGVHGAFLSEDAPHEALQKRPAGMMTVLAAALGILAAAIAVPAISGLSGFEVGYRSFLAVYGLMVPAYVVTCAWPIGASRPPTARTLWCFGGTVVTALPFYWLAFIEREYEFAIIGVALVILGGVIANVLCRSKPEVFRSKTDHRG